MATTIVYNRDTSKDIFSTVYTDSTILIPGMPVYNDIGVDTGKDIKSINNDTFDIDEMIKMAFIKGSGVNSFTIDETTYTTDSEVLVSFNEIHTLTISGDGSHGSLYIDTTDFGLTTSCTFSFTRTVNRDITVRFNKSPSGGLNGDYKRPYTISYNSGSNN